MNQHAADILGICPAVYTIPPQRGFLDSLVFGLDEMFGHEPLAMSDVRIILPNRRAIRALEDAFMIHFNGQPAVLPRMVAVGDIGSDNEQSQTMGLETPVDLPPPMPNLQRHLLLTRLILQGEKAIGAAHASPAEAIRLASELMRLLDQLQIEGKTLADLQDIVRDDLAVHWERLLDFLNIIGEHWNKIVADAGFMEPMAHRNAMIAHFREQLEQAPPTTPIIAAGSTGSNPETARLLSTIARLPMGAVVLPGFDREMDRESWHDITLDSDQPMPRAAALTHPQAMMKQLLARMNTHRQEVRPWPVNNMDDTLASAKLASLDQRHRLLQEALRPAGTISGWRALRPDTKALKDCLDNLSLTTCSDPREESGVIALIMRHVLETPSKTAALVTANRTLARRVKSELERWGIEIDDSAGTSLSMTPPGVFFSLLTEAAAHQFSPISLLALLKHPLAKAGIEPEAYRHNLRQLELHCLRGPAPDGGLKGLQRRAQHAKEKSCEQFVATLTPILSPVEKIFATKRAPLRQILSTLVKSAEQLTATQDQKGSDILWRGQNGEALAGFMSDLLEYADTLEPLNPLDAPGVLAKLLQGRVVRKPYGRHPRLNIWGTLEARLQHADVMILGDMNEGSWPPQTAEDPWMSRPMRLSLGLPTEEQRIGQSALDFINAASAGETILTRSEKIDGTPTVPSRWLLRLEAFLSPIPGGHLPWRRYADMLDQSDGPIQPVHPPRPTPPVKMRPSGLSVTQIEKWVQDPYALYASKILGLKPLPDVDEEPSPALRGQIIHEALETFSRAHKGKAISDAHLEDLLEHGRKAFGRSLHQAAVWAFWWPRFEQIAAAFIDAQKKRQPTWQVEVVEQTAEMSLNCGGADFTLNGRVDRIDRNTDSGSVQIIDYKTGSASSVNQIEAGYAPQLPLLGMLAQEGHFKGLGTCVVEGLSYWEVRGGKSPLTIKDRDLDVSAEITKAREGLIKLVTTFRLEGTPYLSNPRPAHTGYGDYDHLARVKEWVNEDGAAQRDAPTDKGQSS